MEGELCFLSGCGTLDVVVTVRSSWSLAETLTSWGMSELESDDAMYKLRFAMYGFYVGSPLRIRVVHLIYRSGLDHDL